ncbi:MAG: hypothetical protein IJ386_07810 [Clostridia bacterium]|nr:hypothetical protein [Clostridia bacterium]
MNRLKRSFLVRHPVLGIVALSAAVSVTGYLIWAIYECLTNPYYTLNDFSEAIFLVITLGFLAVSPVLVTVYNIVYLVLPHQSRITESRGRATEYFTVIYGGLVTALYMTFGEFLGEDIVWGSHWSKQLYNEQLHSPIAAEYTPTLVVLAIIAVSGYVMIRATWDRELPPIPAAVGIGAVYIGILLCVLWIVQFISEEIILCIYPANLVLISVKLIREAAEKGRESPPDIPEGKGRLITAVYTFMASSANLPWLGFLAALPLLGLCIVLLALFGQAPDSIIRVWTQTADWTLSNYEGPQNIMTDQHYLCTVAAGGHRKVVKPIRAGMRHGHTVIVNRQLCIANAFEELLQERLPRFHKAVRGFYDRYGYPVAKHIRSPYAADAVWFLMKPLEWLFLLVLYTFDIKPENRIAVQYPHKAPPKI